MFVSVQVQKTIRGINELNPKKAIKKMASKTLLIIEDDKVNAFILKKFLSSTYHTDIAQNPDEALEKLNQQSQDPYFAILMDINLGDGEMDGSDLLKEVREIANYETTPVIATTAYAMSGDREKFIEEGFTDYIAKPIQKEDLIKLLEQYT